ncbi:MAG: homoserine acetyltransferase [Rheinheimera sp.]|uniref:E22 family MetX-like putative esterase n=1 Tax=Arsukibacterium sp. UBA3155 TaxID=1946058 RepID=UPI000C91A9B4|nr:homoserine O-acetyltransferase [Arsukibacterium sp. UBA3155]MAD75766.1 homoserine acetyltransferase [Rheinheimera sp.]|tara:strand:+ start:56493 stop:57662 length:1170 start_codon:yes stop_codon:yes gene_type:complete
MKFLSTLLLLGLLLTGCNSQAMLVEKQAFEIANFKTENGALISPAKVGWEAYGKLNADKSNVILITHFFSGSSHAAGKYKETDAAPGYWDAIIGPGKAIDTDKYYVISVDTLVNANVFDPTVITTGPATVNPATGKPYGLSFPVVTIGDFVEVQKALLDNLGINKLHAVIGGSMGSFQAIEWATRYPDRVERLIPVIGTAYIDAWAAVRLERWAYPIKQDPAWRGGDYYQHGQPEQGLTTALAYIIQDAVYPTGFNMRYPAPYTDKAPHQDILASFSAWDQLMAHANLRAKMQDANHILYLIRASQLYRAGMGENWQQALSRVTAKTLFLPASGDQLLLPTMAKTSAEAMTAAGKTVEYAEIPGIWGHLDGVVGIAAVADNIRTFLESE